MAININRYINGEPVDKKELKNLRIANEEIIRIAERAVRRYNRKNLEY